MFENNKYPYTQYIFRKTQAPGSILSKAVDVLKKILEEENVKKKIDAFVRYLAAYRVVESNYGLFDKLARPRDIEDFTRTVYESIRVRDRVLSKLYEGVKDGKYKVTVEGKLTKDSIERLFGITKSDLEEIIKTAKDNPRLAGSIIASFALSYEGVFKVEE